MKLAVKTAVRTDTPLLVEKYPAHCRLVEAMLAMGESTRSAPSYLSLWQDASVEQRALGKSEEMAERSLELLVTEVRALFRCSDWFRDDPLLRDQAIVEAINYWTESAPVASRSAHEMWRCCWDSRLSVTHNLITDFAELAAAVAAEQQMERAWIARWQAWTNRLAPRSAARH